MNGWLPLHYSRPFIPAAFQIGTNINIFATK